jgi:L-fucose isomerase-like protein
MDVPRIAVPPCRPAEALLTAAHSGLADAARACPLGPHDTRTAARRYAAAHLAALRAAAAVLAARARPGSGPGRPTGVWVLLTAVAPELAEWAAFFAAGAGKRAAAEAGVPAAVTVREADDLFRDTQTFVELVESGMGLSPGARAFVGRHG